MCLKPFRAYAKTLLVLFLLGNLFILKNLVTEQHDDANRDGPLREGRNVPSKKDLGLEGSDGHDGWHLENDSRQWRLVKKSRQILDFRGQEFVLYRQRLQTDHDSPDVRHDGHRDENESRVTTPSYGPLTGLNCAALANITVTQFVAAGWTKAVYKGKYQNEPVAIKQVDLYGHDMTACLKQPDVTFWDCYRKSAAKILKEIVLLRELAHPNVLKVFGYCIPSGDPVIREGAGSGGVSMITELGETLDIIRLLQSSWEDRLRMSLGITRLIHHLAHSPLGTLLMNDFRRQQFVLVNGEIKLSDVDDMQLEEPSCHTDEECTIRHAAAELVLPVACFRGRCDGHNEKQNIYNAGRHFVSFLLPHGAPSTLRPPIDEIVAAFTNVSLDTGQLMSALENVQEMFISGKYLKRTGDSDVNQGYKCLEHSDLPGMYDYRCQLTLSGSGCTMSVFDDQEAMEICDGDRDCQAFVITPQKSWTGRRIAHFKTNYSFPTRNEHTTLCVKVS